MTDKNVQIKDLEGNKLYPKTKSKVVINEKGEHLGGVEANAQVNKIEKFIHNGNEVDIINKTISITENTYSLVKQEVAENGYSATYYLTKNGEQIGEKINILKDMFIQSGEVKTVTIANQPVQGYQVGDVYIDMVLANSDNTHIYIPVNALVDKFNQGTGIIISENTISIDTAVVATKTDLNSKQNTITTSAKLSADLVDDTSTTHKFVTSEQLVNINTITNKANKATTLAGYGITDALTYEELT